MNYSPVLISVYDRVDKLQSCVNSLLNSNLSGKTELFISSDNYIIHEDKSKVERVRNYIETISGFKKVNKIYHDNNMGQTSATLAAIDIIFKKFDRFILMEDDIEVSPLFLKFMNEALEFYYNDSNIFSVCGFSPQIFNKSYNSNAQDSLYTSKRWAPWGFAISKSKFIEYENFRTNDEILLILNNDLKNKNFRKNLKSLGLDMYNHLVYCAKKNKIFEYDDGVGYFCLKNNYTSVYSYHSLTKNTGNDGSGQRSLKNDKISNYFNFNFKKSIQVNFQESIKIKAINDLWYSINYSNREKLKSLTIKIGFFDLFKKIHRKFIKIN
ncbi:glycosyltransferase [Flavobacteriaceae bacterium]|nr:glycosyltransferase [Flavobacteriaceae bacterium]